MKSIIPFIAIWALGSISTQAADTFYLLTRTGSPGNYQYTVECRAPNGTLLKSLDLPGSWNDSSDCAAIAGDGAGVWIAHRYDRDTINKFDFWSAASGAGSIAYQSTDPPAHGYVRGLAMEAGTLFLVREHIDPGTDRVERYRQSDGAYLGRWDLNPHSSNPYSAQAAGGALYIGEGSSIVSFNQANGDHWGSFPTIGTWPLCGNSTTLWTRDADGVSWRAYTSAGARQATLDVTLDVTSQIRDACMAPGPDVTPSAGQVDFGTVQVGSSSDRTLGVENRGTATLTISSLDLPATVSTTTSLPLVLAAGQSGTIALSFTPATGVTLNGELVIHSSDTWAPALPVALVGSGASTTFFVVAGNPGAGDGQSWPTAFASITDALTSPLVLPTAEIWVRQGTYQVPGKLVVDRQLSLFGGFAGNETERDQRDWEMRPTIIDAANADYCFDLQAPAVIDGFTVQNGQPPGFTYGGAFYVSASEALIENCLIRDNTAKLSGSAVATDFSTPGNLTLRNCEITGNTGYSTTVILCHTDDLLVEGCRLHGNLPGTDSTANGGGIKCTNSDSLVVRDTEVRGHTNVRGGGGIFAYDVGSVRIEGCTIADNAADDTTTAVNGGGGIYVSDFIDTSSVEIIGCEITGNSAHDGGGILVDAEEILVHGCTITGNIVSTTYPSTGGGAKLVSAGDLTVSASQICDNTAPGRGGGLVLSADSGTATLDSLVLAGNTTSADGGGAGVFADTVRAINCRFSRNTAAGKGAGLHIPQNYNGAYVTGCTVADNTSTGTESGIGIYAQQGSWLYLYNSIVWGNRDAGSVRDGLQLGGSTGKDVEFSDIEASFFGTIATCIDDDPMFADPDGPDDDPDTWEDNDYRLQSGSPCIDTADSADARAPGDDLDGVFRPQDGDGSGSSEHDMGCFEFTSADQDGDGMDDAWESAHGVDDPDADPDGDGCSNLDEFAADTDPNSAADCLRLMGTSGGAETMTLSWPSSTACLYTLQTCPTLDGPWTSLPGWTDVPGTGAMMSEDIPMADGTGFARLIVKRAP